MSTDSDQISETVLGFGLPRVQVYRRSEDNAQDTSSTESTMLEYLSAVELPVDTRFILVQCTSPLTKSRHFREALELMDDRPIDSLLSCCRTKRFFWNEDGQPINYDFRNRPRRQDFDGYLMENGAFYISTVGDIIANHNRLSGRIGTYEMPEYTGLEIDEPHDWIVGEELMKKYTDT